MVSTEVLGDMMQAQAMMYLKGSEVTRRELVTYGVAVSNVSNRVMQQVAKLSVLAGWIQERLDLLPANAPPAKAPPANTPPAEEKALLANPASEAIKESGKSEEGTRLPRIVLEAMGLHKCKCEERRRPRNMPV